MTFRGQVNAFNRGYTCSTCLKYCWWKKSCTTWDVEYPVNSGVKYLPTGAGFLPSTVWSAKKCVPRVCCVDFTAASEIGVPLPNKILCLSSLPGTDLPVVSRSSFGISENQSELVGESAACCFNYNIKWYILFKKTWNGYIYISNLYMFLENVCLASNEETTFQTECGQLLDSICANCELEVPTNCRGGKVWCL